jgi:serine O-acetyltransferase
MREHLKKRDEIRGITRDVLETYGTLSPKLQHLDVTPLPDKSSVIQILDDILEVIYPGYFGGKHLERSNIDYHIGDLLDSIYYRLTQEIYRSVRPACDLSRDLCTHCYSIAEDQSLDLLRRIPGLRAALSEDVQAAYDGDPAAKSTDEVIFAYPAIYTISVYRIAHELLRIGVPLLPRIMTEDAAP